MGQGDSARDFDPSESMENAGILDVFPIFHAARLGAKDPPKPAAPIVRCCLNMKIIKRRVHDFSFRKLRMPDWNRSMPKPMPSSNPSGRILSSFGKLNSMWTLPARILNRRSSAHPTNRTRKFDSFILSENGSKHISTGSTCNHLRMLPIFCFASIVKYHRR